MTTPILPPLPSLSASKDWTATIERYGSAAYQAGFNAALEQVKARIGAMQNRETP